MIAIAILVYIFCALTSAGCAVLLLRSYLRLRVKLVFWGFIFFTFFTLSNILLFFDLGVLPASVDLSPYRSILTLAGLVAMIFGLIKEGDKP